jgi:hypothetical protein
VRRSPRLLPDPLFLHALALRLPFLWLPVRLAELAMQAVLHDRGMTPPTFFITPLSAAGVTLLVATLTVIDVRRRGEHVLLANLGTGARVVFALAVLGVLLVECAVAAIGRAGQTAA